MRSSRLAQAALVLSALLLGATVSATTFRELSLDQILTATEVAFVGTVSSITAETRDDMPWTVVEFELDRNLLGDANQGSVRLAFLGADRSGGGLQVHLMPRFEIGERVLLLAYEEEYYSPVVGFNQGLWRLRDRALVDARDRRLGLDDEGRLVDDGSGPEAELVIDAVARELEARR